MALIAYPRGRLYIIRSARPAIPALLVGGLVGRGLVRALASEFEGVASSQLGVTMLAMTLVGALVILAAYLGSRRAADAKPALTMRIE